MLYLIGQLWGSNSFDFVGIMSLGGPGEGDVIAFCNKGKTLKNRMGSCLPGLNSPSLRATFN